MAARRVRVRSSHFSTITPSTRANTYCNGQQGPRASAANGVIDPKPPGDNSRRLSHGDLATLLAHRQLRYLVALLLPLSIHGAWRTGCDFSANTALPSRRFRRFYPETVYRRSIHHPARELVEKSSVSDQSNREVLSNKVVPSS